MCGGQVFQKIVYSPPSASSYLVNGSLYVVEEQEMKSVVNYRFAVDTGVEFTVSYSGRGCVIVGVGKATVILRFAVALSAGLSESTIFAVKGNVPTVVGVPEIIPVSGDSVKPGGRVPLAMLQIYGRLP